MFCQCDFWQRLTWDDHNRGTKKCRAGLVRRRLRSVFPHDHMVSHAGHFLEKLALLGGLFMPSPSPAYLFTKPFNWLDFDPSYPKNPITFADHVRKWRMDKGLLIRELATQLGVTEDTVINWERRGRLPRFKNLVEKLLRFMPETGKFFSLPESISPLAKAGFENKRGSNRKVGL